MGPEARGNRLLLWHKRLIFTGMFFMLDPVLARAFEPVVMSWLKPLDGAAYTQQVDEGDTRMRRWAGLIAATALSARLPRLCEVIQTG